MEDFALSNESADVTASQCIDTFFELFVVKYNPSHVVDKWRSNGKRRRKGDGLLPPEIKGGKHGKLFQKMIATWGGDIVIGVIKTFFATTDPRITRGDYSVEWLYANAQYILTQQQRLDPVTSHNIDAARKAMED